MENGNNPFELCYLIDTAQQLQKMQTTVAEWQPAETVSARSAAGQILSTLEHSQRLDTLFLASESAYYNDELWGLTDIVKERDLDLLRVLGKFGTIEYFEQFSSFTVTVSRIDAVRTEAFRETGGEVVPSPLFIPVLDIVHAVAA